MREYTIDKKNDGKRLDRWLSAELPALPMGLMQKFIRLKRIKVNGKGAEQNSRLHEGDLVQLYIGDEFFINVGARRHTGKNGNYSGTVAFSRKG